MTINIHTTAEELAGHPERSHSSLLVPLGEGPPTREEMLVYYPPKFTWTQIKTFVNSGDLGLLKRDKKLQERYDAWAVEIKAQYGSMVQYLLKYRLQWGKPDRLSLFRSALDDGIIGEQDSRTTDLPTSVAGKRDTAPQYFTANAPSEYLSIIQNDWPYSVPSNIEHTLIWTRLPIFHPSTVPQKIATRVEQDGLWGFTGTLSPPPSPSTLTLCLPALADWEITMDRLVRSQIGTEEEEAMVRHAGIEVHTFVKNRWVEEEWETAWFVNPLRLQSVLGLAHIHVFARHKTPKEIEAYNA